MKTNEPTDNQRARQQGLVSVCILLKPDEQSPWGPKSMLVLCKYLIQSLMCLCVGTVIITHFIDQKQEFRKVRNLSKFTHHPTQVNSDNIFTVA